MRKFNSYIFLGNGKASDYYCWQLHKRLDEGLSLFSGLQQPCHGIPDDREARKVQREILDVLRDISIALGYDLETCGWTSGGKAYNGGPIPDDWDANEPAEPVLLEIYRENKKLRRFVEAAVSALQEIDEYLGGVEGDPDGIGKDARDALALIQDKPAESGVEQMTDTETGETFWVRKEV